VLLHYVVKYRYSENCDAQELSKAIAAMQDSPT